MNTYILPDVTTPTDSFGVKDTVDLTADDNLRGFLKGKERDIVKGRFIKMGIAAAAGSQAMRVGGLLFENGVAFYTYAQYAPKTLIAQYFYANATHEAAMQILNFTILGVSASTLATTTFSLLAGILVTKTGVFIYNLSVDQEKKVSLSLVESVRSIFFFR